MARDVVILLYLLLILMALTSGTCMLSVFDRAKWDRLAIHYNHININTISSISDAINR